jgi:inosine-uridine nucleoside N-ribohydrolase
LDADTANEIDDLYAIIRMLRQDRFEVLALNSAQWFHYLSGLATPKATLLASQQINEDLVRLLDCPELPTLLGAPEPMGKPWGGYEPKEAPAVQFIIRSALALPPGEKLYVVCIGAASNLASALKLRPDLAPRIKAYVLGFRYDRRRGVWNKSEFNVRRDLNAADYLLNLKGLELHVMPIDVAGALVFEREDTFRRQARMGALGEYLTRRWKARFPEAKTWIMWDITLIEALLHPEWAAEEQVATPPENTPRKVWMYSRIEVERMRQDFWRTAEAAGKSP